MQHVAVNDGSRELGLQYLVVRYSFRNQNSQTAAAFVVLQGITLSSESEIASGTDMSAWVLFAASA